MRKKRSAKKNFYFYFITCFIRTQWIEASGNGSYHDLSRVLGVELKLRSLKLGLCFAACKISSDDTFTGRVGRYVH